MVGGNFTRRSFLKAAGMAAAALPFVNLEDAFASSDRPNFVFILTDDQRYDSMGCTGHPFIRTPHMDRIAKEGAIFLNAFVTISLCAPSRACFLTGRYAHSHGVTDNKTPLDDGIPTFAQALQKTGYDTAFIGKWHMDGQEGPRPGFNRWVSFRGQGEYIDPVLNIDGKKEQVNGYMTDLLTRYALDWLKQSRQSPFCLCLWHKAVHAPCIPAVRHSRLYSDDKIPRPATINDDLAGKPKWLKNRVETHGEGAYENSIREYNRTLMAVDDSVGMVLDTLEDLGVLDNTVVVFAGDNGFFHGEHGLRDKRAIYEESIRIPLLIRYPKLIKPGTTIEPMVLNIDMCPTFLELAGAAVPQGVQGKSIIPVLNSKARKIHDDFLYEYFYESPFKTPSMRGVRTERWKYVEYPDIDEKCELYDLKKDPTEMKNLIDDPSSSGPLQDMRQRLARHLKEKGGN